MKTIKDEVYKIYFDEVLDAVVMEWNGYATSSQFREGTELMLNTLVQNNCSRVLAKLRNMTLIALEDQNWLENNFIPRAIKLGFKSISIIKPESYFSKVAIENIYGKVDGAGLKINFFDNPDEAMESLKMIQV